jgi:AcrR family transcriptional regulator
MARHSAYDRKRRTILDATLHLLVRDGYPALTMDAVVAAAGVSKGTLYHYWGAKDALVEAALVVARDDAVTALRAAADTAAEPGGAAGAAGRIDAVLALARPWRPGVADAALAPVLLGTAGFEALQVRLHSGLVADLTDILNPALADLDVPDPEPTAALLASAVLTARVRMVATPRESRADQAARWLAALLQLTERAAGLPVGTLPREDAASIEEAWR